MKNIESKNLGEKYVCSNSRVNKIVQFFWDKSKQDSWYCLLCKDVIRDIRRCDVCGIYGHEECVGFMSYD